MTIIPFRDTVSKIYQKGKLRIPPLDYPNYEKKKNPICLNNYGYPNVFWENILH